MSPSPPARPGNAPVRVSVLVMCYEHEPYIARALDSVLAQGDEVPYEILIGDDASTDRSRSIITDFAEANPDRIRTFFPEGNLGLDGKAIFNQLLERARGEYVANLDGDDYWTSPAKLQRQVTYLDEHPECSMCFHNVLWVHEDGSRPPVPYNGPQQASQVDLHELLGANPVSSCSAIFRRGAIHPLPDWFFEQPWGDWQLAIIAAQHGKVRYLPELMGVHRTHPGGMWSQMSLLEALEGTTTCQERLRGVIPPELEWRRRQALGETWAKRALEHARLGDRAAARRCLRESFEVWPLDPRRLRRGTGEKQRIVLWLRLNLAQVIYGRRSAD